jgi:nicotinate-nucleotide adenylyltransferase
VRIALFGGAFDPVHSGHLAAARAAQQEFDLDQVLFVPACVPPHKRDRKLTPFVHRYTMVALACAGERSLVPSLLEANEEPNFSIETVRKVRSRLGPADRLYFLVGVDAFLGIREWREPAALLDSCDFIIVSRPGHSIAGIAGVVPPELRGGPGTERSMALRRTCLHVLDKVNSEVSSSVIRRLASQGRSLKRMVPAAVEDYIQKLGIFLDQKSSE